MKFKTLFIIIFITFLSLLTSNSFASEWTSGKITGYLSPDFQSRVPVNQGFRIDLIDSSGKIIKTATTDITGFFELSDIEQNSGSYSLGISKACYLKRKIENIYINNQYGTKEKPIEIWAGDIMSENIQDNAINLQDIITVAKSFNALQGSKKYNVDYDFNKDNSINFSDIMIIAKHFNQTGADYPKTISASLPISTGTFTPIPTASKGQNVKLWNVVHIDPEKDRFMDVAYNGKIYVAVGTNGNIYTSADGEEWSKQDSGASECLCKVACNGEIFVVIGHSGTLLYSKDGISWSSYAFDGYFKPIVGLDDIIWDGRRFVSIGNYTTYGMVLTSENGITWSDNLYENGKLLYSIVYNGSEYVAVGKDGAIMISEDLTNWQPQLAPTSHTLKRVIWDGSMFAAEDEHKTVITSKDGTNWETQTDYIIPDKLVSPVPVLKYDNKSFFYELDTILYNGRQYIAYNDDGEIITSTDAINWEKTDMKIDFSAAAIVRGDNKFIAIDYFKGDVLSSANGIQWTKSGSTLIMDCEKIVWTGKKYIACGNGEIFISDDGITWENYKLPKTYQINSIAWNEELFVLTGLGNAVFITKDFKSWDMREITELYSAECVHWDGESFVILGNKTINGYLTSYTVKSRDGLHWEHRVLDKAHVFENIIWNGNQFIGSDGIGYIITSNNGIDWNYCEPGYDGGPYCISTLNGTLWDGDKVVIIGPEGRIIIGYTH